MSANSDDVQRNPVRRILSRLRIAPPDDQPIDWKRIFFIGLGTILFLGVYFAAPWPAAVDPNGEEFELSAQGKAAIALFLVAAIWWVFEVVPIGVTSILIGVLQALFFIRPDRAIEGGTVLGGAELAFKEFFHPSVWFIFGSIVIGMVFTKTGLTKRLAYLMLSVVGEKHQHDLSRLLRDDRGAHPRHGPHRGGCDDLPALLVAIYRLYDEER
jgi:hypothetical protein